MTLRTEYKFKPALLFGLLTPLYDLFGGYGFRSKLHEEIFKKVKFRVALAEELPYKNDYFDAIWCSLTLHHLPTEYKKRAIREIYRVLKPKGKCFLVIFSKPKNTILAKLATIQNLFEHTKDNYEGRIPQFVKEAGFKNIKEKKVWAHISLIQAMK